MVKNIFNKMKESISRAYRRKKVYVTQYTCKHENIMFYKNLSDSPIRSRDKKSIWICQDCGSLIYKDMTCNVKDRGF